MLRQPGKKHLEIFPNPSPEAAKGGRVFEGPRENLHQGGLPVPCPRTQRKCCQGGILPLPDAGIETRKESGTLTPAFPSLCPLLFCWSFPQTKPNRKPDSQRPCKTACGDREGQCGSKCVRSQSVK